MSISYPSPKSAALGTVQYICMYTLRVTSLTREIEQSAPSPRDLDVVIERSTFIIWPTSRSPLPHTILGG